MSAIQNELEHVLKQLQPAPGSALLSNSGELNELCFRAHRSGYALVVHDFCKDMPLFVSPLINRWLGDDDVRSAPYLAGVLQRSDCDRELGRYFRHFKFKPAEDLCSDYNFITASGSPLLLYGCSRCIAFDEGGKARIIITLLWPVDHLLQLALKSGSALPPTLSDDEVKRFQLLSPREKEVMKLMLSDKTDVEIAAELDITCDTIRTHRSNLLSKLELKTVAALHRFSGLV
ncbi:MAG: hypothetical protein POELPBGB_00511 [Bacteroidia bacterium]|nr:hypothetical protein [Bacteroidia bacterium]